MTPLTAYGIAASIVSTHCSTDLIGTRVPDRAALVAAIATALQAASRVGDFCKHCGAATVGCDECAQCAKTLDEGMEREAATSRRPGKTKLVYDKAKQAIVAVTTKTHGAWTDAEREAFYASVDDTTAPDRAYREQRLSEIVAYYLDWKDVETVHAIWSDIGFLLDEVRRLQSERITPSQVQCCDPAIDALIGDLMLDKSRLDWMETDYDSHQYPTLRAEIDDEMKSK